MFYTPCKYIPQTCGLIWLTVLFMVYYCDIFVLFLVLIDLSIALLTTYTFAVSIEKLSLDETKWTFILHYFLESLFCIFKQYTWNLLLVYSMIYSFRDLNIGLGCCCMGVTQHWNPSSYSLSSLIKASVSSPSSRVSGPLCPNSARGPLSVADSLGC